MEGGSAAPAGGNLLQDTGTMWEVLQPAQVSHPTPNMPVLLLLSAFALSSASQSHFLPFSP